MSDHSAVDLEHVEDARWLADVFDEADVTADEILELTPREWRVAVLAAGARRGRAMATPSDAVRSLVWHRLAERERLKHAHPLEGLGLRG